MIKEEFDSLKIEEQITFINSKLKEGLSLTKLCKNIGIARSTISGRFKRNGYNLDKNDNVYKSITKVHSDDILESNIEVYESTPDEFATNNNIISPKKEDFMQLVTAKDKLLDLVNMHTDLKDMLEEYRLNKNIIDIPEFKVQSDRFKGELKPKTFKVYESVLNDFLDFAKVQDYKTQDVISQALVEFLDRYKR
ncbi:hypothetical protein [Tepidibacter sp. Z1-5]|uniref:hypothetical protein n=1 Tax=Tepidibacter sp. Z1-5 TaxID=3134138 RepID=UPI0030C4523F